MRETDPKNWWRVPPRESAREVLKETERQTAIKYLFQLLQPSENEVYREDVAVLVGQIDSGNEAAIDVLVKQLQNADHDSFLLKEAAERLEKIDPSNQKAINFLVNLIQTTDNGDLILQAAESLSKFNPGNQTAIAFLIEQIETHKEHEYTCWVAASSLGKITCCHETARETLEQLIESTKKYCRSEESLNEPLDATMRSEAMSGMDAEGFCWLQERCHLSARSLGEICPGNVKARETLEQLIEPNQDEYVLDDYTLCRAATSLGKISQGNEKAIRVLVKLIQKSQNDENLLMEVVESLGEIGTDNETASDALEWLIQRTEDVDTQKIAAEKLWKINPCNETTRKTLVNLIQNGWNTDEVAANSLDKILQSLETIRKGDHFREIVTRLKHYMTQRDYNDNFFFYEACYGVIWRCAQSMTYPEFYQAWHGEPSPVQALENQLIDIASLQPTDKTYPIAIDAQTLKLETNTSALAKLNEVIAQKFCTKIYRKAGYFEIPTVNDTAQLQQYIPRIQEKLQKPNLALILHGCEPNEHLM